MKGNKKIIEALNQALLRELTAINQYFLHARMLEDWGLETLGKTEYKASIQVMKSSDEIIKRILLLEGLPNLQKLGRLKIGQSIPEVIKCDLEVEKEYCDLLTQTIEVCESEDDFVSRQLMSEILAYHEQHVDWLETQQNLINSVGLENFIQKQIGANSGHA